MCNKIAYVLTVGFGASDEAPIQIALDEVLRLGPYRVIVVHDRKGHSSSRCAQAAVESRKALYAAAGVPLELMPVDQDETTLRWRAGVVEKAFDDSVVDMVFVFATDFDKLPTDTAREGWRKMVEAAGPNALVLGDYQPKPGSFKDEFYKLVAKPTVEAVFPEQAAALMETGLRQLRTEFFVFGRGVLNQLRRDAIMWTMDPTTDMALACLRTEGLALRVVDLGSFEDRADTRDPLGELFQVNRYVFQLIINLIRLRRSARLSRADQIRVYEDLIPVIDRAVEVGRYAVRRNLGRLKENPKVAAFQPEAPWEKRWVPAPFHGFSYLLDNPGNSLVISAEGLPLLSCDISEGAQKDLAPYHKLASVLRRLERRLQPFSYCPLSLASLHITLWDGLNQSNAASLTMARRAEYEAFAAALPASVAWPASPVLPAPVVSLDRRWTVRFRFKELHIWAEPAALVALLEPADEESKTGMEILEQHRRDLDTQFGAIGKPPNRSWTPHVSCGYFKTSEDASAAKHNLPAWTELIKAELGDQTIEFSSASLYSFTSMERFYRHSPPAMFLSLPAIRTAIAQRTGSIGECGDQKILISYQYGTREQFAAVPWQPLARSGSKHHSVTPYGLDVAVFDHRAKQERHYHRGALELYRVLEGRLTIWVGGVKHVVAAGEEIIAAPYAVHEVVPETPFIATVIVANATKTDKFPHEGWAVPGGFSTPGLHLQPAGTSLPSCGAKEIFSHGPGIGVTAFDERWSGGTADCARPATRVFTMLAGSMSLDVNNERYDLNAGDMMVVFPLAAYQWRRAGPFRAEVLTLDCP